MKLIYDKTSERPTSYMLWLSSLDTHNWATRTGAVWPCSTLSGRRVFVAVDSNGLCEINRPDADGNELEAMVADHLPSDLRHLWPCWEG